MPPEPLSSTLLHQIRLPIEPAADRHPTLLLLHGRGSDEGSLLRLLERRVPRCLLVSVRAPFEYEGGGFTWYDVPDAFAPDPEQFKESYNRLAQFIVDVKQGYPAIPGRVFLVGFSMGSVMAFALSLTMPELVRGIAVHSGYIPESLGLEYRWDRLQSLSALVLHGVADSIVPVRLARRAHDLLRTTAAALTYREYPLAHRMSDQSLNDLSDWIETKAAGSERVTKR